MKSSVFCGDFHHDARAEQSVDNVKALLTSILQTIDGRYAEAGFKPVKVVVLLEEEDTPGFEEEWKIWCNGVSTKDLSYLLTKAQNYSLNGDNYIEEQE